MELLIRLAMELLIRLAMELLIAAIDVLFACR